MPFHRRNNIALTRFVHVELKQEETVFGFKVVKSSLPNAGITKFGCKMRLTNENSDNGNQKATQKMTKMTYNHFIEQFNSSFPTAIGPLSRFTKNN